MYNEYWVRLAKGAGLWFYIKNTSQMAIHFPLEYEQLSNFFNQYFPRWNHLNAMCSEILNNFKLYNDPRPRNIMKNLL